MSDTIRGVTDQTGGAQRPGVLCDPDGTVRVRLPGAQPISGVDAVGGTYREVRVNADGAMTGAYRSSLDTIRPANTTAYTAGDVVGGVTTGVLTFPAIGPNTGHILLTSSRLRIDVSAIPSGMTSFTLHLYKATPPSALADNAAWDLPAGDRAAYLGSIALGTPADLGSTLFIEADALNHQVQLGAGETALYGYLVTAGGFTSGANSEVYSVALHSVAL